MTQPVTEGHTRATPLTGAATLTGTDRKDVPGPQGWGRGAAETHDLTPLAFLSHSEAKIKFKK